MATFRGMVAKSKSAPEGASQTRQSLVLAAERLVAQHGVRGFSTQMLHEAAGARNASALQYHFGSRAELIRAVWQYRMTTVNPQRLRLLEGVEPHDIDRLVNAIILPLAEQLEPRPEGNFYLRFLERLERGGEYGAYGPHLEFEGLLRANAMLREALDDLAPDVVEMKLRFATTLITSGLAGLEADIEHGSISVASAPVMVDALRRGVVALLLSAVPSAREPRKVRS